MTSTIYLRILPSRRLHRVYFIGLEHGTRLSLSLGPFPSSSSISALIGSSDFSSVRNSNPVDALGFRPVGLTFGSVCGFRKTLSRQDLIFAGSCRGSIWYPATCVPPVFSPRCWSICCAIRFTDDCWIGCDWIDAGSSALRSRSGAAYFHVLLRVWIFTSS